jgi:hypothetical protein
MDWIHLNYWVFGLYPSLGIPETRKHDISETGSISILRWRGEKTPTQLGPLERANLNHFLRGPTEFASSPPSHEDENRSSFRNVMFSSL